MEYKVVKLSAVEAHIQGNLNAWAEQGWRVIAANTASVGNYIFYTLERELR